MQDREEHQHAEMPSEPQPHLDTISLHAAAGSTEIGVMLKAARLDKHRVISPGGETFSHSIPSFFSDETTLSCVSAPFPLLHSGYATKIMFPRVQRQFSLEMFVYQQLGQCNRGRSAEQNIWCCGCSTHTTQTHGGSGMEGVTLGPIFQFSMDLERARFAHSETASLGETA